MRLKDNYHLFAIITILFWSSAFVFTRLALKFFTPFSLGFLRCLIASLALLVIAIIIKIKVPQKEDLKWFILSGFFGFFFYMIVFNAGSVTVTASTASIILATAPVFTTILAGIIYKEKIRLLQYIAIIIEFAGVGVLTLMNGVFSVNIGLLWLLIASISISVYNLLQRKISKKYSSIQTVVISIWFGTAMLLIFIPNSVGEIKNAPFIQIVYLLIMGIFCSGLAFVTWTHSLSKAKNTSSVTNYMFITPLLTTVIGFLLAKETPDYSTIIGGSIILIGIFIFNFSEGIIAKVRGKGGERRVKLEEQGAMSKEQGKDKSKKDALFYSKESNSSLNI
uniref:Membrane protein n=1 Tax=uncultured bacterium contig00027 TaxID=1181516 RepID=A0A806K121_9BACT|nr:membrane protein [uncultured bacterium contig00027]